MRDPILIGAAIVSVGMIVAGFFVGRERPQRACRPRVAEGFGMPCKRYPRAGRFTTLPRVLGSRKRAHAFMSARLFSSASPRR
jgi:hypothetical protein